MATQKYGTRRTVPHRRKRDLKTNYKKRLGFLKSGKPRLVIRKTNKTIIAQIVQYKEDGDKIIVTATSRELVKFGWKAYTANTPSAYLTGLLVAKKALKVKVKEAIIDFGLQTPVSGGKLYATVKGAVDGGLEVPHGDKIFPSEDRIKGKHVEEYAKKIKQGPEYKKQFSKYTKNATAPEDLTKYFEQAKKKIMEQ
jgi:large subunit ribosomal protein L18